MNKFSLLIGMLVVFVVLGAAGCATMPAKKATPAKEESVFVPTIPFQLPAKQDIDFPDVPPTRIVKVMGDVPGVSFSTWQEIGVRLSPGDVLYIKAEGQVGYYHSPDETLGPDGRGNAFSPALLPKISFMSLVGRTAINLLDDGMDSSGIGIYGPGFVGSEFKMTCGYNYSNQEPLYLAVNDSCDDDNSLSFTVRIWVVRDGKVIYNTK